MPRVNLPPYVQCVYRGKKPDRVLIGYRGWWMRGEKRCFGPTRKKAQQAYADAMDRRQANRDAPSWGGTLETRANEWLADAAVRVTTDSLDFCRGKLAAVYRTIPKSMPVDRITPAILREFVREAREKHHLGARTVQHCRRVLNAFFRWMIRRGFVTTNPVPDVEWPKPEESRPDVFTEAELIDLLARITDPWAQALALFIAGTGLRRAEVCRVQLGDVDAAGLLVWVRGKVRAEAQPIHQDAAGAVALLLESAKGREFLIPGSTDRARRNVVAETFRKWQRELKEPRFHPHALRHTLCTVMQRNGAGITTAQRALRHASVKTTQGYSHLIAADARDGMARLRLVRDEGEAEHG